MIVLVKRVVFLDLEICVVSSTETSFVLILFDQCTFIECLAVYKVININDQVKNGPKKERHFGSYWESEAICLWRAKLFGQPHSNVSSF